jgi:hypothetical protein
MKVIAPGPYSWFLLEESGRYYFDARVSQSAAEWSILMEPTSEEYREYHALGRVYLDYLAARIQNSSREYQARSLDSELGESVARAVEEWMAEGGMRNEE